MSQDKNTYENTEITDNGANEHMGASHHKCISTNKYVWELMEILDKEKMYGFHFETRVGKEKILVVLQHEDKIALKKAQKLLKNVEKNSDILFLTKLKAKKKERNYWLILFISILVLLTITFVMTFLHKMGYLNFIYSYTSFNNKAQKSNFTKETNNTEEPIIEEIVVDIEKLTLLKESFDEQNNSTTNPEVLKALTLGTAIISEVISEEEKAKYSSEALVQSFKRENGFKLVVKDDGSNKDFNRSIQELNEYAMAFVKENNFSEALNYYDKISKEHNLTKKEAMINEHYKANILEEMGLTEEAKDAYNKALSLSKTFPENNNTSDSLAFLEKHNLPQLLDAYSQFINDENQSQVISFEEKLYQSKIFEGFLLDNLLDEKSQTISALNELINLSHIAKIHDDLNETKRVKETTKRAENLYKLLILELKKYGEVKLEELALSLNYLANFYIEQNELLLAIQIKKEALKTYEKLLAKSYKSFAFTYYKTLNSLAKIQIKIEKINEAKKNYQKAFNLIKKLVNTKTVKDKTYIALSYRALAMVAIKEDKLEEAKKYYNKALKIYMDLKPKSQKYSFEITDMHEDFANLYALEKKFDLAKKKYQAGAYTFIQMNKKRPLKYHLKIAHLLNCTAIMKISNYDINSTEIIEAKLELLESINWAQKAIDISFKNAKESLLESYAYLAYVEGSNQKMTSALKYYRIYHSLDQVKSIKELKNLVMHLKVVDDYIG